MKVIPLLTCGVWLKAAHLLALMAYRVPLPTLRRLRTNGVQSNTNGCTSRVLLAPAPTASHARRNTAELHRLRACTIASKQIAPPRNYKMQRCCAYSIEA